VNFDIELIGSCDDVVAELSRRAEWELKHEMIPDDDQGRVVKVRLEEESASRWIFGEAEVEKGGEVEKAEKVGE